MTKRIKLVTNLLALLALPFAAQAQDIHFSQFYETSILRNPALTGVFTGDYKVGATFRSQWNSIGKPFQTGMVNAETRFALNDRVNDYLSVGLMAFYDKAGSIDMQTVTVTPAVNYNKSLEDAHNSFLSVGFMAGITQRSFDPSKVTVDEDYMNGGSRGAGENFGNSKFANMDLGAGISFSSSSSADSRTQLTYYLGISGYHFTQPKNSFYNNQIINLAMRLSAQAGFSVKLNDNYNLQGHLNVVKQGDYNEVIGGGLLGWSGQEAIDGEYKFMLFMGAFYRYNDAVIPTVKIKYNSYSFGVSYDMNVSGLRAASNLRGGYEVTAFKTGLFKDPKFQKSKVLCPHSFW
ncbi:MAG: type IX secretion system membrane protein PorP/SprF [Sphingobacteriales bacterium]|nr:MAG: type IX secretion system membrane protein PorP/SprF [Sphingobacteriales bacterium]